MVDPHDVTGVVAAATALMIAGVDVPGIVALAGDDHADHDEVLRDLHQASSELGLEPLTADEAVTRAVRSLARAYLNGDIPVAKAARDVWRVFVETDFQVRSDDVRRLAGVATGLTDVPEYVSEADFREAAEAVTRILL